jgi:hypothetical protein
VVVSYAEKSSVKTVSEVLIGGSKAEPVKKATRKR